MSYSGDQRPTKALERDNEWSDEDDRIVRIAWRAIMEKKGNFTGEADVDNFLRENRDLVKEAGDGSSNLLHALIELLGTSDIDKLDDILPLVKCLVQDYPYLLHTWDGRKQNPVFLAISKKQWTLAEYMIKYCDDNPRAQLCLTKALEMPCSTKKDKTCLHLALDGGAKPSLLLKLVRLASDKALEAQDNDGKTPLHYAVIYSHCSDERLEIIGSFLERDQNKVLDHTKTASGRSLETFLDLKDNSNRSVYQEHLATAEWYKNAGVEGRTLEEAEKYNSHREANGEVSLRGGEVKLPEEKHNFWRLGGRRDKSRDDGSLSPGVGVKISPQAKPDRERAANIPIKPAPTTEVRMKEGDNMRETIEGTNNQMNLFPRNSEVVLRMLKLHYMRTRDLQKATLWLYGTNPNDIQMSFDYEDLPAEISGDLFKRTFSTMQFGEVLKYVRFTQVNVRRRKTPRDKAKGPGAELGRRDMEFFLDWLHDKGVRYILKLTVEEDGGTVHSDGAIKAALDKVTVEHLDWQKTDLDFNVICGTSGAADNPLVNEDDVKNSRDKLRVLDLKWSGNDTVLRAWSEPQGLPMLRSLQTVNIHLPEDVTMHKNQGVEERINDFERRLNMNIADASAINKYASSSGERHVSVFLHHIVRDISRNMGNLRVAAPASPEAPSLPKSPEKVLMSREWLECMESFAQSTKAFWNDLLESSKTQSRECPAGDCAKVTATTIEDDVVVALIDDGVGALDEHLAGRIVDGKTFDYHDGEVGQSYTSAQGHGTEMAKLILRMCPMAKIYPIRLKTYLTKTGESSIDLESAALAIQAARDKNASIISMSWSIPVPTSEDHDREKKLFEKAIEEACNEKRILFCSAPDKGQFTSTTYPSSVRRDSMFRIGAANEDGTRFRYTDKYIDYILPGVKVNSQSSEITGSSVATALAAGLAATIIYCFKTSALATKITLNQGNPHDKLPSILLTDEHVRAIAELPAMKTAFRKIGVVNEAQFVKVWDLFKPVRQDLANPNKNYEDKRESLVRLCSNLMD